MTNITLEELFKDRSKEEISAFAYNIGRMLEAQVRLKSKRAEEQLKDLQAKVISYRSQLPEKVKMLIAQDISSSLVTEWLFKDYDDHFEIYEETEGKTN